MHCCHGGAPESMVEHVVEPANVVTAPFLRSAGRPGGMKNKAQGDCEVIRATISIRGN